MLLGRLLIVQMHKPSSDELAAIAALLSEAALPALQASSFRAEDFRVVRDGASVIGVIGVERYEADGLLRSLVVAPQSRGRGIAEALVREIEHHARDTGLRSLCLLTTTAERFFDRLGYERIPRDAMPATVRRSSEFSILCPATAVCMRKVLNEGATP